MAHPNEKLLRIGYEAVIADGVTAVTDMFDDNIRWHVPGRHRVAGDYHGKWGVEELWRKLMGESDGTFQMEVHDVLANDEHGVALLRDRGRPRGRPWRTTPCTLALPEREAHRVLAPPLEPVRGRRPLG